MCRSEKFCVVPGFYKPEFKRVYPVAFAFGKPKVSLMLRSTTVKPVWFKLGYVFNWVLIC